MPRTLGEWIKRCEDDAHSFLATGTLCADCVHAYAEEREAVLRQAVGLATTLKGSMILNPDDPVGMMREVVEHVHAERVAQVTA